MEKVLKERLWAYLVHNNPDLLFSLQQSQSVTTYIETKIEGITPVINYLLKEGIPSFEIEDRCLNLLTKDLKPSKYHYVRSVLEEEFSADYEKLNKSGILVYEVLQMLKASQSVFEDFEFSHENYKLRHAVIVCIHDYLIK